jgi:hypothetical protein
MTNKNSTNFSLWARFVKRIKKLIKIFQKKTNKQKNTLQRIQLTFIYFFAIVVLFYSIKGSLGFFPETLFGFFPFFQQILEIKLLKFLATPEKTFLLYLFVLEYLINRSLFNLSLLVKFNVLLIFILEMIQNLVVSYWDLFFNREVELSLSTTIFSKSITIVFFCIFFVFFFGIYLYSYFRALQGLYPILPGFLAFISESVAFWLQIKVNRKEDKGDKSDQLET